MPRIVRSVGPQSAKFTPLEPPATVRILVVSTEARVWPEMSTTLRTLVPFSKPSQKL